MWQIMDSQSLQTVVTYNCLLSQEYKDANNVLFIDLIFARNIATCRCIAFGIRNHHFLLGSWYYCLFLTTFALNRTLMTL